MSSSSFGRPAPLSFLEIVFAAAVVVGICALGCATPTHHARPRATVFQARQRGDASTAFVERELHRAGLRFGTDGTPRALWGYMRSAHEIVSPAQARPGDVVFFDVGGRGPDALCADHAGIVRAVAPAGRITFEEVRAGERRESYVDPASPHARRDDHGEILNTFLRPKRPGDPDGTRYYAGEMLCAVARVAN